MADIAEILQRMADDREFASVVEHDPATALRGSSLSVDDICRIEDAIAAVRGVTTSSPRQWAEPSANSSEGALP